MSDVVTGCLNQTIETLKPLITGQFSKSYDARNRLWRCRAEVTRTKAILAQAEADLSNAEHEDAIEEKFLRSMFDMLKTEVMRIPIIDLPEPSSVKASE